MVTTGAWPARRTRVPGEGGSNLWERFVGDRAALSREFSRNSGPGVFAQKAMYNKENEDVNGPIDRHSVQNSEDGLTHEDHGNHKYTRHIGRV